MSVYRGLLEPASYNCKVKLSSDDYIGYLENLRVIENHADDEHGRAPTDGAKHSLTSVLVLKRKISYVTIIEY